MATNGSVWDGAQMIAVSNLTPNSWNPNVQRDEVFNSLCEEIEKDGFDEPIIAVPIGGERYRIVNGEHRYHAAKILGLSEVPVVIKENWTEEEQKIKTVRRNMLKGELDKDKFNQLIQGVADKTGKDVEEIARQAVISPDHVKKYLEKQKEMVTGVTDQIMEETRHEISTIDDLSLTLRSIIDEYGDTIPNDFLYFLFKNKMHMMVRLDDELKNMMDRMSVGLKQNNMNVRDFLKKVLASGLSEIEKGVQA